MDFLAHLWLPIVASAVAVWIASALAWMLVGHHKGDWQEVPNEDSFIDTVERMGIPPGSYGFPEFRKCEGLSADEKKAKWESMQKRPIGILRVWGPISMGRNMAKTFVVYLVASVLIGYLGWHAFAVAAAESGEAVRPDFLRIMQVLGTAGILTHCFAGLPGDIWFQKSRREIVTGLADGVVFGLITGAVFAWLWPA